ncbi:MAG: hypothetical protein LBG60_05215 [Bifidobacteriaceae bacterium]|jgi:hypothetical protein|nr:hypothetical protein [Bifidobacteriaceae bacterium]
MSAVPAIAPVRRATGRPAAPAPQLRLVAAPKRRRGFQVYVAVCLTMLLGALGAVLWLNTALAAGAFEIHELEVKLSQLEIEREVINEQLVALAEPQGLAARASQLGMIEAPATGYIILLDKRIVGSAPAAGATDPETGEELTADQLDEAAAQAEGAAGAAAGAEQ